MSLLNLLDINKICSKCVDNHTCVATAYASTLQNHVSSINHTTSCWAVSHHPSLKYFFYIYYNNITPPNTLGVIARNVPCTCITHMYVTDIIKSTNVTVLLYYKSSIEKVMWSRLGGSRKFIMSIWWCLPKMFRKPKVKVSLVSAESLVVLPGLCSTLLH